MDLRDLVASADWSLFPTTLRILGAWANDDSGVTQLNKWCATKKPIGFVSK